MSCAGSSTEGQRCAGQGCTTSKFWPPRDSHLSPNGQQVNFPAHHVLHPLKSSPPRPSAPFIARSCLLSQLTALIFSHLSTFISISHPFPFPYSRPGHIHHGSPHLCPAITPHARPRRPQHGAMPGWWPLVLPTCKASQGQSLPNAFFLFISFFFFPHEPPTLPS